MLTPTLNFDCTARARIELGLDRGLSFDFTGHRIAPHFPRACFTGRAETRRDEWLVNKKKNKTEDMSFPIPQISNEQPGTFHIFPFIKLEFQLFLKRQNFPLVIKFQQFQDWIEHKDTRLLQKHVNNCDFRHILTSLLHFQPKCKSWNQDTTHCQHRWSKASELG